MNLVIRKSPVECPDKIINNTGFPLEFIPYLIRGGNDMFFQSVPSLFVIPAKAGIQELIDNLSIVDKQKHEFRDLRISNLPIFQSRNSLIH
jgi:hypothetical protein